MKFLVVDDDPNTTFRVIRELETSFPGSAWMASHSEIDAMCKLDLDNYTAIITIFRKSLNGFAIALKAKKLSPDTLVVLMSFLQNLDAAARREGIDFVLPYHKWNEIGRTVQMLINKRN